MIGNPEVIAALQTALASEVHLNAQYRLDWRSAKYAGLKKLKGHVKGLGTDAHLWIKKLTDRILFLGGKPGYVIPPVSEQPDLGAMLNGELALEVAGIQPAEDAFALATAKKDDTTRNIFEHLLKAKQKRIGWLEQQARLMKINPADYTLEKM